MELHHKKHHQTYVNGLNAAEEAYAKTDSPKDRIKLHSALKFNGGGHINHSLFWKNLAPQSQGGGELPAGALKEKIEADFGSVDGERLISILSPSLLVSLRETVAYHPCRQSVNRSHPTRSRTPEAHRKILITHGRAERTPRGPCQ